MADKNKAVANTEDGFEEVRSNWVKFNKVDDYVKGTLIEIYTPNEPDQYGKMSKKYVLKALEGKFFGNDDAKVVDDLPTMVVEGEIWRVGSKPAIDAQMTRIKVGQKVMFKLTELRKSTKGNPAKIIKVLAGPMDQEWLDEQEAEKAKQNDFEGM